MTILDELHTEHVNLLSEVLKDIIEHADGSKIEMGGEKGYIIHSDFIFAAEQALETINMKAVEIRPNNWVVQHPSGIARPGVHATEEAAILSMYIPAQKLQANYVTMRKGGSPFTVEAIRAMQM